MGKRLSKEILEINNFSQETLQSIKNWQEKFFSEFSLANHG